MSDPFVGEIRIFAFNFAPTGWALCTGSLLPISQNTALFSLLGTTYGGNGVSTFALPDLRARTPLHPGQGPGLSNYSLGEMGGEDAVTLITSELPAHTHSAQATTNVATLNSPANNSWAMAKIGRQFENRYSDSVGAGAPMNPAALTSVGGSVPHNNRPPYCTVSFCIALQGIFPPRN